MATTTTTTTTTTNQTCRKWFVIFNFVTNFLAVPSTRWCQALVRQSNSRVYSDDGGRINDLPEYTTNSRVSLEMASLETINSSVRSEGASGAILPEDATNSRVPLNGAILPEDASSSRVSLDALSEDTTNSRVSVDSLSEVTTNSIVFSEGNTTVPPATSSFNLEQAKLVVELVRDKNLIELQASWGVESVLAALGTHFDNGIPSDDDDFRIRKKAFGCNKYPKINSVSLEKLVRHYISRSCKDVPLYASFFLSFGVRVCSQKQGWKEGGYMILIAFVYSVLSSILDFGVEKYLDNSVHLTTTRLLECSSASVVRNGSEQLIPVFQIVVGDVIFLKAGQDIPADGLLIHHEQPLSVIEWDPVSNNYNNSVDVNHNLNPFLFSGSRVITTWTAKMVVTAVGTGTRMWDIQAAASVNHSTELQVRVQTLISMMKKVNFGVSLVVLIVMLARYFSGNSRDKQGSREFNVGKTNVGTALYMIIRIILVTVTIGLALVSESYLWVVKICHGYKIKRMAAHGILVQKVSALEKMGSVTSVVVTERTGELIDQTHLRDQFGIAGVKVVTAETQESISDEEIQSGSRDSAVRMLKERGEVVAILTLDDDENVDAHALEQADVRVFVSSGSSDENERHVITKAGSYDAYILKCDGFPYSVIKLLMWGRCVLDNTRKLIHFQLTAGVVSLLNSFIYAVSQSQTPAIDNRLVYSLLQLVWVNLVLGLLAAVAFSREKQRFQTRRVDSKESLIYGCMWRNIAAQVVYQTILIQVLQFKGGSVFGLNGMRNDTMSFLVFFSCQVINMFNARNVEEKNIFNGIRRNRAFMVIVIAIIVMQLVFVEILHKIVEITRLDWKQRMECFGLSLGSLVVGVAVKLLPFPN